MKLTIIRLQQLSTQDKQDLRKIWPQYAGEDIARALDERHRLYAARFNDRLLGALRVEIRDTQGKLYDLSVREVTRRRGVGQYLLEDTLAQNPTVTRWWIAHDDHADQRIISTFMQACGFHKQDEGWLWTLR